MIDCSNDRYIHYHTDNEVGFEWLFLCFMAKDLLTRYRARPTTHNAKQQQGGFRHPPPGPARRHFVRAVHRQRQYVGNQKPYNQGIRGENAACRRENE